MHQRMGKILPLAGLESGELEIIRNYSFLISLIVAYFIISTVH